MFVRSVIFANFAPSKSVSQYMEWINDLFVSHSAVQALVVISIITGLGLALSKLKFFGISLGVTFVFFIGILGGHIGLSIDRDMLSFAESFGLVIFVYALGLQVGPGFWGSFRQGGIRLNLMAIGVILLGTLLTAAVYFMSPVGAPEAIGIMCGATTNTPALAAAQQLLSQMDLPDSGAVLGCAVTYPLGVVGVILAILTVNKIFGRASRHNSSGKVEDENNTYIAEFRISNPGVAGKSVQEISDIAKKNFVITRLWRDGKVTIPTSDVVLQLDDHILVITEEDEMRSLVTFFGEKVDKDWNKKGIKWNRIDNHLVSQKILVTKSSVNGKKLEDLKLRNMFGINISRIYRSGVQLLARPDLRLQLGDRIVVVGEKSSVESVSRFLGNAVSRLEEPNLIVIFIGIMLGLMLGSLPVPVPGMETPIKLGLAGGPIIVGILMSVLGPKVHIITYTTRSVNLMLRALGLSLYLACLGLDSGAHFFETVIRPEGLLWIGLGFMITFVPVMIAAVLFLKFSRLDFGTVCGMLCGSMANPMALDYANDLSGNDKPSVAYATVYPLSMFARVIISQVLLLALL